MENSRKIWFDQNDQPPKNYIWYKNGQYLEWNGEKWVTSTGMNGISSDMTEEQKMEVRKNLGLYYEETSVVEKTAKYINEPESALTGYAKVSDDTPAKDDILFVLFMGDEEEFTTTDTEDGFLVNSPTSYAVGVVRVVLNNSQGNEPGIYATISYDQYGVVYNGPVTTIHKIDAKFLPEQEGRSSLPWLDVTSLPSTDGDEVNISSNISQSDYNDLLDGKYVGIHILPQAIGNIENYYTILSIRKAPQGFLYPCIILGNFGVVGFDADNRLNKVLYLIGSDVTSMYIRNVTLNRQIPGPIVLTSFPDTSITTQAGLDAIGLSAANVQKLVTGEASALCFGGSGMIAGRLNLEYATYLAGNNFSLKFSTNTEKYEVTNDFGTITVTKTSLS